MRIILFIIIGVLGDVLPVFSQTELKDAYKAIFQIFAYDAKGEMVNSGTGFFISDSGEAVTSYQLLKQSNSVCIVDYKGNKFSIRNITGVSSNYDIAKFTIATTSQTAWLQPHIGEVDSAMKVLQIIDYSGKKKKKNLSCSVVATEYFDKYKYFTLQSNLGTKYAGCPLVDEYGHVVAIAQKSYATDTKYFYGLDARVLSDINITERSALDADLHRLPYPCALPKSEQSAMTFLYMIGFSDSLKSERAITDFITTYPQNSDVYVHKGNFYAKYRNYAKADDAFAKALSVSINQTEDIHYNFSKLLLSHILQYGDSLAPGWTLSRAHSEAKIACESNSQAYYLLQEAHCLFHMKRFDEAYHKYIMACQSMPREWDADSRAESWYYATRALELSGASTQRVVELLDSVINELPRPYKIAHSPYILERANRLCQIQEYRKAVADYNSYELVVGHDKLNDVFYYLREQAEINAGMYQQALDDIRTAILKNQTNEIYCVEEAYILLRVGHFSEAISICESSLKRLPENPDCYKIMGIAYGELGKRKQAVKALEKAISLGDESAAELLKQYQ